MYDEISEVKEIAIDCQTSYVRNKKSSPRRSPVILLVANICEHNDAFVSLDKTILTFALKSFKKIDWGNNAAWEKLKRFLRSQENFRRHLSQNTFFFSPSKENVSCTKLPKYFRIALGEHLFTKTFSNFRPVSVACNYWLYGTIRLGFARKIMQKVTPPHASVGWSDRNFVLSNRKLS